MVRSKTPESTSDLARGVRDVVLAAKTLAQLVGDGSGRTCAGGDRQRMLIAQLEVLEIQTAIIRRRLTAGQHASDRHGDRQDKSKNGEQLASTRTLRRRHQRQRARQRRADTVDAEASADSFATAQDGRFRRAAGSEGGEAHSESMVVRADLDLTGQAGENAQAGQMITPPRPPAPPMARPEESPSDQRAVRRARLDFGPRAGDGGHFGGA